ncbi:MAG TPA: dethiobiotin synthase [Candidatus Evtepia faecigallinarum]|nr:dethiobiotin synthase [Candidatus Evtepia faecigallinarum]
MAKALFVTGTGTDVGKTYVTGLLVKALTEAGEKAAYYKAAMSGNRRTPDGALLPGDGVQVKTMAGIGQPVETMCPYVYEPPLSPHLAARLAGEEVDPDRVRQGFSALAEKYDYLTMEGSGGILCPITVTEGRELWLADLIRYLGLGCLLVADAGLGTLNAIGLTAFYLRKTGISLRGMILNRYDPENLMHRDNRQLCQQMTGVPVVACVGEGDTRLTLSPEILKGLYTEGGKSHAVVSL